MAEEEVEAVLQLVAMPTERKRGRSLLLWRDQMLEGRMTKTQVKSRA